MALESSTGISPFPFLWVNRTMRVYHYSDIRVMAATFPTVAYGSLAWSLALTFLLSWVMAFQPSAYRISNVSDYFIQFSKNTFLNEAGMRWYCTPYIFVYFTLTSKPRIALIRAALILPFNSISTTIYIFPCSS